MPASEKLTVVSVENAKTWSWGLIAPGFFEKISNRFQFIRMTRPFSAIVKKDCPACGSMVNLRVDSLHIDDDIVEFFDLLLLQNLESIRLVDNHRNKIICRSGGLVMDDKRDATRYNDFIKQCGAVIATNNELADIAKAVNPNTFMIPNGIDLGLFRPTGFREDPKPFKVGFAGNIMGIGMKYKGFEFFAQAMIDLHQEAEYVQKLHGHNQIEHDLMPEKFYHRVDCIVLPSIGEGCNNVIMEALACGVPVVCTKVGYHGEELTDGENCLFIERSRQDIVDKVRLLISDKELRLKLSRQGRLFAEENHNVGNIAMRYSEVFSKVHGAVRNGKC